MDASSSLYGNVPTAAEPEPGAADAKYYRGVAHDADPFPLHSAAKGGDAQAMCDLGDW